MDLLVIIVNYQTADHVLDNLEALVPELRTMNALAECWIVDNNSPDNSVDVLSNAIKQRNYQDKVHLITHPRNDGFGAGNNVALLKAMDLKNPPDYFYLLNPDAVAMPGTIGKMLNQLKENANVGVVGGPVLNTDGTHNCGAFRFPSLLSTLEESISMGPISTLLKSSQITYSPPPDEITKVGWVSGASLMTSKIAIQKAGTFDEGYFLYFEEVDLCKRVTLCGLDVEYNPEAPVIHVGGAATGVNQSSNRLPEFWHSSRRRYLKTYFGMIGRCLHNVIALLFGLIGHLHKKIRRRRDIKSHYLRDLFKYNFLK